MTKKEWTPSSMGKKGMKSLNKKLGKKGNSVSTTNCG